jgi:DNA-binding transcriptional ArsR family regulator
MYDYNYETEDKVLKQVGLELMFLTPEKCTHKEGISAVELAHVLGLDICTTKKKLRILKDSGLVRSIGINPKFWRFDDYIFQRMDEDDPIYRLLTSFDDVDFGRYFQY